MDVSFYPWSSLRMEQKTTIQLMLGPNYSLYTSSWQAVAHYFNQSNHSIIINNGKSKIKNTFASFTASYVDVIRPMFKGEIWTKSHSCLFANILIPAGQNDTFCQTLSYLNDLICINAGNCLCEVCWFGADPESDHQCCLVRVLVSQLYLPAVVLETH